MLLEGVLLSSLTVREVRIILLVFNRHQARWDLRTVGFTGAWQVAKVWGRVKQKFRCEPGYNQVICR